MHGFDNNGTEDAKFLAISTPGVMTPDYFREIHDVLASTPGSPPDPAKLADVMRRHGLTPAPPDTDAGPSWCRPDWLKPVTVDIRQGA